MGAETFFGTVFIAFGPPCVLFAFTVARKPQDVIIFISSAFFWLISLFFSGCLWRIITVNTDSNSVKRYQLALGVVFAVVFQELFRFLFYKLLK
jgi:anterior pharynx defective protein 1